MNGWLIIFWVAIIAVVFVILVFLIQRIWNHFRGKKPVDYGYTLEKIKVFLDFPSFRSFYLAAPEQFYLGDETVCFSEGDYVDRSYGFDTRTRIGFKTLADLWAYQDWKEKLDSKKESAENDEATLKFCQSMTRVLEKKKQDELKKAQDAAQEVQNRLAMASNKWPNITLAKGDDSGDVLLLQNLLINAGFGELAKDRALGIYDEATATAVRVFRLSHNLGNDDIATPEVIKMLQDDAEKMKFIRAKQTTIEELVDATMRPLPPTTDSILGGK